MFQLWVFYSRHLIPLGGLCTNIFFNGNVTAIATQEIEMLPKWITVLRMIVCKKTELNLGWDENREWMTMIKKILSPEFLALDLLSV